MAIVQNESDLLLKEMGFSMLEEYAEAVALAGFNRSERVFDVATGSGRMAATLARAGYSVISGDIDPNALDSARERLRESGLDGVEFMGLDATNIPFENQFASIVCANAIHHLEDPILAISQMTQACTQNGKLMIIEFSDNGFDIIESVHQSRNRGMHERGDLDSIGIESQLRARYTCVDCHELKLNIVWIASQKISK